MRFGVKNMCKAGVIAALYAALTLALAPVSFGAVQFRVSEALTVLPVIMPEAIPGLFIGCLLANMLGQGVLIDVICGSLATLAAAIVTWKLRKKPLAAVSAPVFINALVVGPVVYFCYVMGEGTFSPGALALTALTVGLGEAAVVYTLGLLLYKYVRRLPL